MDVEDQNLMLRQMENGVLGAYLQCHFAPDCCRNYTVIGDAGRLENIGDGPDEPIFVWNQRQDGYRTVGDAVFRGDPVDANSGHGGADAVIMREFVEFARHGGPTTATPEAARMSVATGGQATASLRAGGVPLEVPPINWQE